MKFAQLLHFFKGYYNLLLSCLIVLFIFRPEQREAVYYACWKILFTLTLLSAVYTTNRTKRFRGWALCLAIPSIFLSWTDLFLEHEVMFVANCALTFCFLVLMALAVIYDSLKGKGTIEGLKGVICAYFMIGIAFAYLYYLIAYFQPGAFFVSHFLDLTPANRTFFMSQMFYYSFVTLLQIGYGDITAMIDTAQTASIIEGIFGQFYIAILVSRLFSVYNHYQKEGEGN